MSAFNRPALSVAKWLRVAFLLPFFCILFSILFGSLFSRGAYANTQPQLLPIPVQTFFAQQPFSTRLHAHRIDGQLPRIRLINAPKGVSLSTLADGTYELYWTPPAVVANEVVILVQAFNPLRPSVVSTQRLVLQHGTIEQEKEYLAKLASIKAGVSKQQAAQPSFSTTQAVSSDVPVSDVPVSDVPVSDVPVSDVPVVEQLLPDITAQLLQVDKEFQLFIRPTFTRLAKRNKNTVGLSAVSLPPGAVFEEAFPGSWLLSWRPDVAQLGKHRVELVAVDASGQQVQTEQILVLTVVGDLNNDEEVVPIELAELDDLDEPEEEMAPAPASASASASASVEAAKQSVTIEPLSAQIVSAGQTIRFKVVPQTSDLSIPILHIDRLPRGGSFDPNKDGTRTFHWRTTKADQGQHTFRFTAIHQQDLDVRVSAEVLIVIGNPEVRETLPESPTGNVQQQVKPAKIQNILQQKVATIIDPSLQDVPMPGDETVVLSSIDE